MPNHVTNNLIFRGDKKRIHEMLEAIQNDEKGIGSVDFNKIIVMPESLNIEAGSKTDGGLKAYREFIEGYVSGKNAEDALESLKNIPIESEQAFLKARKDIEPDEWELGKTAFHNLRKYGHATWYEWSIENWDTKWNAYNHFYNEKADTVSFQTAWSNPTAIINRLAKMYPDIDIHHCWADENFGYNCGEREFENGELVYENLIDGGSKEAYEFAADVLGCDPAELGYQLSEDGSTYEYHDDFEESEMQGGPVL